MLLRDSEPVFASARPVVDLRALAGLSADVRAPFCAAAGPANRSQASGWHAAVSRLRSHSRVDVVVLGASVSAGCGSIEPPLHERCAADNHSSILTGLCKPEHGWARALADELSRLLQSALGRDVNVRVNVVARNAMRTRYFAACTARFFRGMSVPVVLLDTAQVDAEDRTGADSIGEVVHAIRQLTRAAVTFVVWSKRSGNGHHSLPPKPPDACADAAKRWGDVASRGVDVLRADLLVHDVVRRLSHGAAASGEEDSDLREAAAVLSTCTPNIKYPLGTAWAKHGDDVIHPSPEGHQLLGREAARYVADQLLARHHREAAAAAEDRVEPPKWERCYPEADTLPVAPTDASTGGWRMVDDGVAKGVKKLGLRSERVGDRLVLGPFEGPGAAGCFRNSSIVELGYRLSRDESNGAFRISCSPHPLCVCRHVKSQLQKTLLPFPVVDTNARLSQNHHYRNEEFNATITTFTSFLLTAAAEATCRIFVDHLPAYSGISRNAQLHDPDFLARQKETTPRYSRVQVSTLFMRCWDAGV